MQNSNTPSITLTVGDRVRGGQPGTEDYDEGVVVALPGDDEYEPCTIFSLPAVLVAWDSEVRTWTPTSELEVIQ